MNRPLVDFEAYFENKGHQLNEIGIELLALNKYLSGCLDTDEPFPFSNGFLAEVKKDVVSSSRFYDYVPGPFYAYSPIVVREKTLEEIKKSVEGIGLNIVASVSSRKPEKKIADLICAARSCFKFANISFYICHFLTNSPSDTCCAAAQDGNLRDKYAPEIEPGVPIVGYTAEIPPEALTYQGGDLNGLSDVLPNIWAELANSADSCLQDASRQIGYWKREIEMLRRRKKGMKTSIKQKEGKYAEAKQRVFEIYKTIDNRSELLSSHPYELSGEIRDKLKKKSHLKEIPHRDTIKRWLEKEYPA